MCRRAGAARAAVAGLVGPQGRVVGVDTNAGILEVARARVEVAGWADIAFRADDVMGLELDAEFDAVVGRWVLQYTPDPAALLRRARGWLRPDEVGIDTLEERLRAEVAGQDGVQLLPAIVGAWART